MLTLGKARKDLLASLDTDDRVHVRSVGGKGAAGFLEPPVQVEGCTPCKVPDAHFKMALKFRLRYNLCRPGARCQHRDKFGALCNEPLDPKGHHALQCGVGGSRKNRHNTIRDFCASYHQKVTGYLAPTEQWVPAWDRTKPNGELEEAILDVATRDAVNGRPVHVDAMVTCAHSGYEPSQRARANKDGLAASNGVDDKRRRYPPAGGDLVPLVFEAGGRPSAETISWVRSRAHELPQDERSEVIRYAWQEFSRILQVGSAEMVLSAIG